MNKITLVVLSFAALLTLAACGTGQSNDKFTVVTTTTYIGDMVRQVGGNRVHVETLMEPGVDPHDYQPRQSDTDRINDADFIVVNGLNLEEKMVDVLQQVASERILVLGDHVAEENLLYEEDGVIDPHIWFDIDIWKSLVSVLADRLGDIDPDNATFYETRANEYIKDLDMLDVYIRNRVEELPEEARILVTAHDAFAYFGNAYGFEVHAVQGISTESEASIADIENLAQLLVDKDVNRVFWETSVPQSTVDALVEAAQALNHDVSVGGELYSDSTGGYASGHETYIRTYRANIDIIIDALTE